MKKMFFAACVFVSITGCHRKDDADASQAKIANAQAPDAKEADPCDPENQIAYMASDREARLKGGMSACDTKKMADFFNPAAWPKPNLSTPDSDYVLIDDSSKMVFYDLAFNKDVAKVDPMPALRIINPAVSGMTSNFDKQDALKAARPELDRRMADAKAHPYIILTAHGIKLNHYDFEKKGFKNSDEFFNGGFMAWRDADVRVNASNPEQFQFLKVVDETAARQLEALDTRPDARIYGFFQGAGKSPRGDEESVLFVTKLQILDKSGKVILEQKAS